MAANGHSEYMHFHKSYSHLYNFRNDKLLGFRCFWPQLRTDIDPHTLRDWWITKRRLSQLPKCPLFCRLTLTSVLKWCSDHHGCLPGGTNLQSVQISIVVPSSWLFLKSYPTIPRSGNADTSANTVLEYGAKRRVQTPRSGMISRNRYGMYGRTYKFQNKHPVPMT